MKLNLFNNIIPHLSTTWKDKYGKLLPPEHWNIITERITLFVTQNEINHPVLPIFKEEIIPDYLQHYQYFVPLKSVTNQPQPVRAKIVAATIEATPIASLLIILGQRKTPATITNENGIPPLKAQLLEGCFAPHNAQKSKAARAREKHIARNAANGFWGTIMGTPAEKEAATQHLVSQMLEEKTWWNIFTHYKHEVVYEIRVASGEGIRWKMNGLELIGFLEPFE